MRRVHRCTCTYTSQPSFTWTPSWFCRCVRWLLDYLCLIIHHNMKLQKVYRKVARRHMIQGPTWVGTVGWQQRPGLAKRSYGLCTVSQAPCSGLDSGLWILTYLTECSVQSTDWFVLIWTGTIRGFQCGWLLCTYAIMRNNFRQALSFAVNISVLVGATVRVHCLPIELLSVAFDAELGLPHFELYDGVI